MSTVIAKQGDTVDLLCFQRFGYTAKVTEQTFDRNPGLADLGVIIPTGTKVLLPDFVEPATKPMVNLWD